MECIAGTSTYKFKRAFFRHDRRTAPKFGTHVRIEMRLALTKNKTLRDRRDDEQRGSPYDAKCNVAEIGVVNMGEIGAVRKRSR